MTRNPAVKVAAETRARLSQLRGWTETEFFQVHDECQFLAAKLKAHE